MLTNCLHPNSSFMMSENSKPPPMAKQTVDQIAAKVNAIKLAKDREARARGEINQNGDSRSVGENTSQHSSHGDSKTTNNVAAVETASSTSGDSDDTITIQEKSLLQKIVRTKLINNKHDIEILRRDPSSPLHSVKSFEALHLKPELLKGVYAMGFNTPSKIQETAVPTLLANPPQNMIAQSQSGTGKTAAFVLAMLSRIDPTLNYTQALCLSPTYELAVQTGEVVAKMASYCRDITIKYALRGEENPTGTEHIVIGTPGKVVDWGLKYKLIKLNKLTVFILDEADVMIATQGHQEQSIRIRKVLSKDCQMMLFSATYDQEVMEFAEMMVPNPVIIRLRREEESLENIKQYYVKCMSREAKYRAMANIYGSCTVGQAIVFCQTKKNASWLCEELSRDGHAVALLIGDLTVEQRITILDRFREAKHRVLITTNVLARGIDIEQVTLVVNFDLPVDRYRQADCETYLHRIGRTGRFGKTGLAINLIDGQESMDIMRQIERHFGIQIELLDVDSDDLDKLENYV